MKKKINLIMKKKIKKRFTWLILLALITSFYIQSLLLPEISPEVDDASFYVPNLSAQNPLGQEIQVNGRK